MTTATKQQTKSLTDLLSEVYSLDDTKRSVKVMPGRGGERPEALIALAKTLGLRYARCTLENYRHDAIEHYQEQGSALESIKAFAAEMPRNIHSGAGVTLYGNPGTGKDHLLCALMFEAILKHGLSVEWVNCLDLYAEIRGCMDGEGSELQIIRRYQKPTILVLSDPLPPKGDVTRYNAEILYRIIDRRYRDCKSTWATMNALSGSEADGRIAQNIIDRLRDNTLAIKCPWESYRKAAT